MNSRAIFSACSLSLPVALSLPMAGCISVTSSGCTNMGAANSVSSRALKIPHQASQALRVSGDNGEISISQSTGTDVAIDATIKAQTQERADAVQVIGERGATGELHIYAKWPDGKRLPNEGCSFVIAIPDASRLAINTSNGRITVNGLAGEADLRTSNGRIIAQDFAGNVRAESSNGAIELTSVLGASADTSNGRIEVALKDGATGPVDLESSNGGITLRVASSFAGDVDCKTSNGGVSCDVANAQTISKNRSSATFRIGVGGATSTIRTSNGRIQVSKTAH